jgi:hypothetical protein
VICEGEEGNLKKRRGRLGGLVVGLAGPTSSPSASLDALSVGKLAGVLDDSACMNNGGRMVMESEMWK